ncbi:MAG: tetratricopeptide repeat protein [Chitinophagales bacterium]
MNRIIFIAVWMLLSSVGVYAQQNNQDFRLAFEYYKKGEYDKAVVLYEKIYKNGGSEGVYRNYYNCLLALKNFEEAEKVIKKRLKRYKDNPGLYVDLGLLYRHQQLEDQAKQEFEKAIDVVTVQTVGQLSNVFSQADEYDYAIATLKKGQKLQGDEKAYAAVLAQLYAKKGDYAKVIDSYLDYAVSEASNIQTVQSSLQRIIKQDAYMEELQTQLYGRIQQDANEVIYPELLTWTFIQQKDFESALIQAKALDRRFEEDGDRIMDLARMAIKEKDYNAAIEGYQYVIDKEITSPMQTLAKIELLKARKSKVTETNSYTQDDIEHLRQDYHNFLDKYGRNATTTRTMRDLAHLYAYYVNDLDEAIKIAEEIVNMSAAEKRLKAESKLDLGDYYLMQNDIWEATLYYAQVDKDYKEDNLGEVARFKNAKLSYYNGDFQWSQSQLNVLKASTSELIANDALELSVFITDNMGLDTSTVAMEMFARADLLILQNKQRQAFVTLDSIDQVFRGHALADDVLFARARVHIKKREYEAAVGYLEKVLEDFGTDILADNALFTLADIYENHLNQKEKAMEYYQKILLEQPGSLFIVEARKRFRKLRGDMIN